MTANGPPRNLKNLAILRWLLPLIFALGMSGLLLKSYALSDESIIAEVLDPVPDSIGFAGGFSGRIADSIYFAGGANFPDRMPWEGGTKKWVSSIFRFDLKYRSWSAAGNLPRPLGYGVSVSYGNAIYLIGGSDATRHYADVFRLKIDNADSDNRIEFESLAPLPFNCANMCGIVVDGKVFIAGGSETPTSSTTHHRFLSLDLTNKDSAWVEHEPWPGPPRMLATMSAIDGSIFLVSGTDLYLGSDGKPARKYLKDAYRFRSGIGWTRIADLPSPTVAATSVLKSDDDNSVFIVGGDDGQAVSLAGDPKHPGFSRSVVRYRIAENSWEKYAKLPFGQVTTNAVVGNSEWIIASGETHPGIRTPRVWSLKFRD